MTKARGLEGERTLLRIHVEEQDKYEGRPVYERIVQTLRDRHIAGATVFRAVEGFGTEGELHHTGTWSLRLDVPIVIECVDSEESIQAILPELDRIIGGGVITLERVHVILYRDKSAAEARDERSTPDIAGSWKRSDER